jgi:hypothetical protein
MFSKLFFPFMIVWHTVLLVSVVLTFFQTQSYIVMLKTPQTSSRLGKRQESNSDLGWALELARAYDAGPFVAVGSAVSTSIITHVYNFGKGIIGFAITTTQLAKEALALHPNVAYCGLDKKYVRQGLPPWMTLWVKRPDLNHHL